MSGKQYVAMVRLSDRAGAVLADIGETCERVPESSLAWLIEQGLIVARPAAEPKSRKGSSEGA